MLMVPMGVHRPYTPFFSHILKCDLQIVPSLYFVMCGEEGYKVSGLTSVSQFILTFPSILYITSNSRFSIPEGCADKRNGVLLLKRPIVIERKLKKGRTKRSTLISVKKKSKPKIKGVYREVIGTTGESGGCEGRPF